MISLRSQVWASAERSVSAIHSSELYAGIRMETSGFIIMGRQVRMAGGANPYFGFLPLGAILHPLQLPFDS